MADDPQRAVIERYLRAAASLDPDAYANVWADDGRLEMPYHPNVDARVLVGRAAIRQRMVSAAQTLASLEWIDPVIRATDEVGTYVVEMRSEARRADGGVYRNRYVIVAAVAGEEVVLWREYFDPTPLLQGEAS